MPLFQIFPQDMKKEDLPQEFINRLEHVDDKGMLSSIQFWTGARRNTASSFIYKGEYHMNCIKQNNFDSFEGQVYQDEELGLIEESCKFMSASIGNVYRPNKMEENGIALEKGHDANRMKVLRRNRPPIGQFYMERVRNSRTDHHNELSYILSY